MKEIHIDREKIDRYFKGTFTPEDELYVQRIFDDEAKEYELRNFLSQQFEEISPENESINPNLEQILYKIHYEINCKKRVATKLSRFDQFTRWTTRIAGVLILPIALFAGIRSYNEAQQRKEAWVEIKAPAWSRVQFKLPDGTTGWLNSNSSIAYHGDFTSERNIQLSGEAFFNVTKDKDHPFVVNTNDINVKVLGTKFNIASYANENKVEVVLQEGKLVFNNPKANQSYTLKPNDLVVFDKTNKKISKEIVQPIKYSSWTQGKLVFRNDPLDVIARRLERWYHIDVQINAANTENIRWRATFLDESLEEVLSFLGHSLPVNYRIEAPNIKSDGNYTRKKVIITLRTK